MFDAREVRQRVHWTERIGHGALLLIGVFLGLILLAPIWMILVKSVEDRQGNFVGLANFVEYFHTPALLQSIWNSFWVSSLVMLITVPAAFAFAYALTRSCMSFKSLARNIALVPLLAPSLLSAISFLFWFGNQGLLKAWMGGGEIYGAPGIVLSLCYATFPHALMILITALSLTDGRLYEAADSMAAGTLRKFLTITLPAAKYGLISASMVVFTYSISDFGVPKVIGGNFNVLATDIFKLVIGQQDFSKGAVVSIMLLLPVAITYVMDHLVQRRQQAQLTARSVPYVPKPSRGFDIAMTVFVWLVCLLMLAVLGMAIWASFIKLWPYDYSLVLRHYWYGLDDAGISSAYLNSVKMAFWAATAGTVLVFCTAYLLEKTRGVDWLRPIVRLFAVLPMGVPGLVLGLGFIFFFVDASNPLHFLYHTMAILVLSTVVHYYSSSHLTAVTALKQLDAEFEAVSASLKVSFFKTFILVTVPVCMPAIIEISRYFFVNAMTTISAAVFLYSPETTLVAVAILNLDEAGDIGAAAAMATLIVVTSVGVCLLYYLLGRLLERTTQAWRAPK
ncbi:MAG: putative 2-aminoethylphosphonate ABC transporter permease subunit [Burkholderiales bacterium]